MWHQATGWIPVSWPIEWLGYRLDSRGTVVRFQADARHLSVVESVQTRKDAFLRA